MGKKSKKRMRILFSCVGTSDPVRGGYDGPMLHIVRQYRPEKIFLYISKEMREKYEDKDDRYRRAIAMLCEQCPGYTPELLPAYYGQEEDVSDFDLFYDQFPALLQQLTEDYPEAEILLNVSSGTTQMQATLMLLDKTRGFRTLPVQVKAPEKESSKSQRTNRNDYDLAAEMAKNVDAVPDFVNRCEEPKLFLMERNRRRTQVEALLKRYDYGALMRFKESLPGQVLPLIEHLHLRSAYELEEAVRRRPDAEGLELYPGENQGEEEYAEYRRISEYLLMLRLMQRTERYTDFVIRLNPLVLQLQCVWLRRHGLCVEHMGIVDPQRGAVLKRESIGERYPQLLEYLDGEVYAQYGLRENSSLSISLCNHMLNWARRAGEEPWEAEAGTLLWKLENLNKDERNRSAHDLSNITEAEIRNIVGTDSGTLVKQLIDLLGRLFPRYFCQTLFSVYEDANRWIMDRL